MEIEQVFSHYVVWQHLGIKKLPRRGGINVVYQYKWVNIFIAGKKHKLHSFLHCVLIVHLRIAL